jgi:hypothetical protein
MAAPPATTPANVTPLREDEEVRITRAKLKEYLEEGAERVRSSMRGAKTAALEAQATAHAAEIARLRDLMVAEKVEAQRDAHAHGFHKAGWMFGGGGVIAGILMSLGVVALVMAFTSEATVRGAGVGSAIRAQDDVDRGVRLLDDSRLQDEEAERRR